MQKPNGSAAVCVPTTEYGNIPAEHTSGITITWYSSHKDIVAAWFEAPAAGTIDSVFICTGDHIGDTTSTGGKLWLRIHHSNIYTGHAPGWNPYVAPPNVCWGYFSSSYDKDGGLAAFQEDASDTTWRSTYANNNGDGSIIYSHYGEIVDTNLKSFQPALEEIWGMGGVEVPVKLNAINGISLGVFPPKPQVSKGYPFFISFRIPDANTPDGHPYINPDPPLIDPTAFSMPMQQDAILGNYAGGGNPDPAIRRTATYWKFYEHPSFCGYGWVARGGVSILIYYAMSAISDVPPHFTYVNDIGHTTDEVHARPVEADIEDCNFDPEGTAGVASASILYSVNGGPMGSIAMANIGGSIWQTDIPAFPSGTTVLYKVTATDNNGNQAESEMHTYKVLSLRSNWYAADTGATRTYNGSLESDGGISIDTSAFFSGRTFNSPPTGNTVNKDDGTAGPFAISNGFIYFGDTMHYAWVGVNGGIALSKTATDTINLNANGIFANFTFPSSNRKAYPDTTNNSGTPRNFIGAMWNDLLYGDTLGQYGHIYHKDTDSQFVVEWNSLEDFWSGGMHMEYPIFRVVLNKNSGIIEFQYDNVGVTGLDTAALIAVQSDSSNSNQQHGYFILHEQGSPIELTPRNNWSIQLWPVCALAIADGWNFVSVPGRSWDMRASFLFPHSASRAFTYRSGYVQDSLLQNGRGYWMKFTGAQVAQLPAAFIHHLSIPLNPKWNSIGSITSPVAKSSLTTSPPGQINTAVLFTYNGSYSASGSTIDPGKGYWVKALANCTLNMSASAAAPKAQPVDDFSTMNEIAVGTGNDLQSLYLAPEGSLKNSIDAYELPPPMPDGFDVRFASGRQVETYSNSGGQYRIDLTNSSTEPVTVRWSLKQAPEGRTFTMTDGDNGKVLGKVILQGSGSVRIENGAVKTLIIRAESGINVPATFALSQNYPNPFNPTTRMQLDVPQTGQVTVSVFDVLGRKVATLVDGVTEAGYHVIEWNGMNSQGIQVPTGTYFVRINTGEFRQVRKIMMMK